MNSHHPRRAVAIALLVSGAIAVLWHLIWKIGIATWPPPYVGGRLSMAYWVELLTLTFAVLLVAPNPRRNSVTFGSIREHRKGVLIVCGAPVLITLAAYPILKLLPIHELGSNIWTIQPLAQELVFFGFIYRTFERSVSGRVVPWCPVEWPLALTAFVFSLWHLPNFGWMNGAQLGFQLAYTFVGGCVVGLARQWTGSLVYGLATHTLVNFIAWRVPW